MDENDIQTEYEKKRILFETSNFYVTPSLDIYLRGACVATFVGKAKTVEQARRFTKRAELQDNLKAIRKWANRY